MHFEGPVSAYLHFIKTASRRCPNINPNSKRYCEFRGLQPWSLAARDDADADTSPAAVAYDPLSPDAGYIVKPKLHSVISSTAIAPLPFSPLLFRNRLFFLDPSGDVSAREQTCLQVFSLSSLGKLVVNFNS